jgi:hypothetical protein
MIDYLFNELIDWLNVFQHDFSSVKSGTDSADTFYDDVITATPKLGVRISRGSMFKTLTLQFLVPSRF